jgi:hypothetical protein
VELRHRFPFSGTLVRIAPKDYAPAVALAVRDVASHQPRLLDRVRDAVPARHGSRRTEKAYDPQRMGIVPIGCRTWDELTLIARLHGIPTSTQTRRIFYPRSCVARWPPPGGPQRAKRAGRLRNRSVGAVRQAADTAQAILFH